jgi:hypothetical protein
MYQKEGFKKKKKKKKKEEGGIGATNLASILRR